MQITAIEPIVVNAAEFTNWTFLRVQTSDGITGVGEATVIGSEQQLQTAIAALAPVCADADPSRIAELTRLRLPLTGGRVQAAAISGLEQALWDIAGKALGVPAHRLHGGAIRDRVPLYANINRATRDRAPQGFAANARQAVAEGFPAVKIAPFDGVQPGDMASVEGRERINAGIERIITVREAIGDRIEFMVDCHWRFTVHEALVIARELEDCRLYWLEDMVADPLLDKDWPRFRSQRPERIAGGERNIGLGEFLPRLSANAWDVACPDVKYCGGLSELQRIAGLAEATGMPVAPHNPTGPVATIASAQIASTLHNLSFLEFAWGECPWRSDLVNGAERISGGYIDLPDSPGLGCELDPDLVAAHPATVVPVSRETTP